MAYCGEQTLSSGTPERITAISLRCRAWTCPDCYHDRKRRLMREMSAGQPNKFITLTMRRVEGMTAEQAAKRLSHAWRLCRLRIIRHAKLKSLPFIAVVEKHKSGWPHLHILARMPWFSQKLLSTWMAELCDGPNVWIEHLDKSSKAVSYCAKYCGKCAQKIGTTKRYWQSRDYDMRSAEEKERFKKQQSVWNKWPATIKRMAEAYEAWGYHVTWVSGREIHATSNPP